MVYAKKLTIKGQEYWYLFHTIRQGEKFLKKSKYIGKELPKNIEALKKQFLNEIKQPEVKDKTTILIESLTPLERKVLPVLKENKELEKIVQKTNLKEVEVMRALQWLQNKSLLLVHTELKEIITLEKNGVSVLKNGLPDGTLLNVNVPPITEKECEGVIVTRQGKARYEEDFDKRVDPNNRVYYWLTGKKMTRKSYKMIIVPE